MFCPKCGSADQNPEAYCRRCGEWLTDHKSARRRTGRPPTDRLKVMMVFNGLSAVFALTSALALYITYLGTPEAKWSVYMAGAMCLVIASHQTANFFMAHTLRQNFDRDRADAGRGKTQTPAAHTVAALSGVETGRLIDAPSVTEKTTELLEEKR